MFDIDKRAFADILRGTMETYNRPISPAALGIWWNVLASYDLGAVQAAFHRHITDPDQGRFPPTPAAIVAQMGDAAGVIGADEAWSLVIEAMDEAATVVVTDLMLEALSVSQARAQWQYDKVGARMAFKSAYDRLMGVARIQGRKPVWQVSVGWDAERRADAVRLAMEGGRLTTDQARRFLPPPDITSEGQAIVGLLAGKVVDLPQDDVTRERLAALRASLARISATANPKSGSARKAAIEAKRSEVTAFLAAQGESGPST